MKILIAILLIANSAFAFAEKIRCVDEKNTWEVSFELDKKEAHNIQFNKKGKLFKDFGSKEVNSTVIKLPFSNRGFITYDISLGAARYLSFDRNFKGSSIDSEFHATFLLTSHPFGFEKHVGCFIEE